MSVLFFTVNLPNFLRKYFETFIFHFKQIKIKIIFWNNKVWRKKFFLGFLNAHCVAQINLTQSFPVLTSKDVCAFLEMHYLCIAVLGPSRMSADNRATLPSFPPQSFC